MRPLTTIFAAACAATAVTATALFAGVGGVAAPAAAASSPTPPPTVKATLVATGPGTLSPGSQIVHSRVNSRRTFFGNSFGVGLGRDRDGAVYPAQTGNGGRTWRTDGPALFLPTADAPLAISTVTAATRSLQYAFGAGGSVVDVTRDGGPQWRRALFDGVVVAVVPGSARNELVAFVDSGDGTTWQYVTRNGGATWTDTTKTVISG